MHDMMCHGKQVSTWLETHVSTWHEYSDVQNYCHCPRGFTKTCIDCIATAQVDMCMHVCMHLHNVKQMVVCNYALCKHTVYAWCIVCAWARWHNDTIKHHACTRMHHIAPCMCTSGSNSDAWLHTYNMRCTQTSLLPSTISRVGKPLTLSRAGLCMTMHVFMHVHAWKPLTHAHVHAWPCMHACRCKTCCSDKCMFEKRHLDHRAIPILNREDINAN